MLPSCGGLCKTMISPYPRKSKSTWKFQLWCVKEHGMSHTCSICSDVISSFQFAAFPPQFCLHIGFFTSSLVAVDTHHPHTHPHISFPPPCPHTQLRFSLSILFLNYSTDRLLLFSTSFMVIACSCSERREAERGG